MVRGCSAVSPVLGNLASERELTPGGKQKFVGSTSSTIKRHDFSRRLNSSFRIALACPTKRLWAGETGFTHQMIRAESIKLTVPKAVLDDAPRQV